jgi:hypothetical protein
VVIVRRRSLLSRPIKPPDRIPHSAVAYIELRRRAADRHGGPPIQQVGSRLQFICAGRAGNLQRRDAVAEPQQLQAGRGRGLVQQLDIIHRVGPICGQRVPRVRAAVAGDVNPSHVARVGQVHEVRHRGRAAHRIRQMAELAREMIGHPCIRDVVRITGAHLESHEHIRTGPREIRFLRVDARIADHQEVRPLRLDVLMQTRIIIEVIGVRIVRQFVEKNSVHSVEREVAVDVRFHRIGSARGVTGRYIANHLSTGSPQAVHRRHILRVLGGVRAAVRIHDRNERHAACRPIHAGPQRAGIKVGRHDNAFRRSPNSRDARQPNHEHKPSQEPFLSPARTPRGQPDQKRFHSFHS